jgi:hypothetical protein
MKLGILNLVSYSGSGLEELYTAFLTLSPTTRRSQESILTGQNAKLCADKK